MPRFTKKEARDIDRRLLNSPIVNFKFIDEDMDVNEIPELFNRETRRRKRLDCLLLTKDAEKTKDITGIITPWDLGDIRGF